MKLTRQQAETNRAAILEAAQRLFRERGFDGVGVADGSRLPGAKQDPFRGSARSGARVARGWRPATDPAPRAGWRTPIRPRSASRTDPCRRASPAARLRTQ